MSDKSVPAFPFVIPASGSSGCEFHSGMSLRDYFAAKALPLILHSYAEGYKQHDVDTCAKTAYMVADAMLAERAK